MQDRSIDGALLALRKSIILGGLEGLPQVEALLALRGVPLPRVLLVKQLPARRGAMPRMILEALRDGPMRLTDLARHVADNRPELTPQTAYGRTALHLSKLKRAGVVVQERGLWGLVRTAAGLAGLSEPVPKSVAYLLAAGQERAISCQTMAENALHPMAE